MRYERKDIEILSNLKRVTSKEINMYLPMTLYDNTEERYREINKENIHYEYNGHVVPRTTEILSAMLHEHSLMNWSNHLGLYQRKEYNQYMDLVANIGTYTHKAVEIFLTCFFKSNVETTEKDVLENKMQIPMMIFQSVKNGLESFSKWFEAKIEQGNAIGIVALEMPIVCEYFGGTVDCILRMNNEIYLIDFKTSNHVSYKHFLQLSAYRYMLIRNYGITPDKCMILQLSKKEPKYTEYVLDVSNFGESYTFMEQCQQEMISLSQAYKSRQYIENDFMNHISKESGT